MIELKPQLVARVNAGGVEALREALQQAVMLEHATIPVYLYALYSIKPESLTPGRNLEVYTLLRSVVLEEMIHMSLACNILNAVGGAPVIDQPAFVPQFPGPLPGAIDNGLVVGLRPISKQRVHDEFMAIEEPEDPLEFPVGGATTLAAGATAPPTTIGQFYGAIREQIKKQGHKVFTGDPARQVSGAPFFPELTPVTSVKSAVAAIDLIVEEGEGTHKSPLDQEDELAHYYKFAEIWNGRRLIKVQGHPGYAYAGDPIPFDPTGVWPSVADPHKGQYPAGSPVRFANDTFNYTYTGVLRALHATFNGQRDQFRTAVGAMESLKEQAIGLFAMEVGGGMTAGPTFEYQPVNP
jgi:hypothetical protein